MAHLPDLKDAMAVSELFQEAAAALRTAPHRRGSAVRLPAAGRVLVTGDLHDRPVHLDKTLRIARLDESEQHHVVLHEIIHGGILINGMDFSYRTLARVAHMVCERPAQVHPLLANHELSQMTGRGVSKGGGNSVVHFDDALAYVFSDDWEYVASTIREFVRAMPLALLSASGLCCSHSLPNSSLMGGFDHEILDRELSDDDYAAPTGSAYAMVWGRRHEPSQLTALAERWGVRLFCVGHQHVETGIDVKPPNMVVINTDHERAVVLPVNLAEIPGIDEAMLSGVPLAAIRLTPDDAADV